MRIKPFELFYWLFIKPYTFYWVMTSIAVGGSILGGLKSKRDANRGARDIENMSQSNINKVSAEEKETLRRMDYTQKQVVGESNAQIAASGVKLSGSTEDYMRTLESNYGNERNWVSKQSQTEKDMIRQDASYRSRSLRNQGTTDLIGGATKAASWWSGGFGKGNGTTGGVKQMKQIPKGGVTQGQFLSGRY